MSYEYDTESEDEYDDSHEASIERALDALKNSRYGVAMAHFALAVELHKEASVAVAPRPSREPKPFKFEKSDMPNMLNTEGWMTRAEWWAEAKSLGCSEASFYRWWKELKDEGHPEIEWRGDRAKGKINLEEMKSDQCSGVRILSDDEIKARNEAARKAWGSIT